MDDARDPAFELGFDRDDKAVASDGDEVFLGASASVNPRRDLRRLSSIARCCRSMARRMRRSSGEASSLRLPSGSILPRKRRRRGCEVRGQGAAAGEFGDAWPLVAGAVGGWGDEAAPCGDHARRRPEGRGLQWIRVLHRRCGPCRAGRWDRRGQGTRSCHHGRSMVRTSAVRCCCRSIQARSALGPSARTQARPRGEEVRSAMWSRRRGHSQGGSA